MDGEFKSAATSPSERRGHPLAVVFGVADEAVVDDLDPPVQRLDWDRSERGLTACRAPPGHKCGPLPLQGIAYPRPITSDGYDCVAGFPARLILWLP